MAMTCAFCGGRDAVTELPDEVYGPDGETILRYRMLPACRVCAKQVPEPKTPPHRAVLLPSVRDRIRKLLAEQPELVVLEVCEAVGLGQPSARSPEYKAVWALVNATREELAA